ASPSPLTRSRKPYFTLLSRSSWAMANQRFFDVIATIAPNLVAAVPIRIRNSRLVADALRGRRWIRDIRGPRTVQVILDFFAVLAIASQVILATTPNQFRWKWMPDGRFTSASAYHAFSIGQSEVFGARRCWISNRQLRHNLKNDDTCALCAQEPETLDHLLLHRVHSRETWFRVLRRLGLNHLAPSVDEPPFVEWWLMSRKRVSKELRPRVHEFQALMPVALAQEIIDDAQLWASARFFKLRKLLVPRL
ncbi:hypothetical protein EJB05_03742, partial [Eragrostis curvula]